MQCALREVICAALRAVPEGVGRLIRPRGRLNLPCQFAAVDVCPRRDRDHRDRPDAPLRRPSWHSPDVAALGAGPCVFARLPRKPHVNQSSRVTVSQTRPEAPGTSLAGNDRGQVAQRVVEMVCRKRRELNVLAGNRPYRRPVIGERDCGVRGSGWREVVAPAPAAVAAPRRDASARHPRRQASTRGCHLDGRAAAPRISPRFSRRGQSARYVNRSS